MIFEKKALQYGNLAKRFKISRAKKLLFVILEYFETKPSYRVRGLDIVWGCLELDIRFIVYLWSIINVYLYFTIMYFGCFSTLYNLQIPSS